MHATAASATKIERSFIARDSNRPAISRAWRTLSLVFRGLALIRGSSAACLALSFLALGCGDGTARPGSLEAWREHRARLDETIWADERLAQDYERTLFSLWDALLGADRAGDPDAKAEILAGSGVERLSIGSPALLETLDHGILRFAFDKPRRSLTSREWGSLVRELRDAGYRLVQSEWHHLRFEPPTGDAPARSLVTVALHVLDGPGDRRISIDGELAVEWSEQRDAEGLFVPVAVDASGLEMLTRNGPASFERIYSLRSPRRPDPYAGIHPVLLYDLDRDGLTDVVMIRAARVLWNRGSAGFELGRLLEQPPLLTESAVLADFDGDSYPDLLAARARGDLVLYTGNAQGRFLGAARAIAFDEPLLAPSVLTAGDIDGDGDLDVWLAQYKPAYVEGQMPSPFYDANDGYPAYLLLNDGDANFAAATLEAGLAAKRFRRSYAGSFVDLDSDADLDLLVVSDYAGIDLYHNDGSGRFTDANHTLLADRHLFGMSAAFADYDLDGRLDFFAAGMGSTTARRLEALELSRPDRPDISRMRMRMGYGNRLYLASDEGWREPDFADQVARTGWTWGTSAFDFDNDGDPDLFAANGNESGESTTDYCSNFWSHDLYDGVSEPDAQLAGLFAEASQELRSGEQSWDGYQKNHLLMNRRGEGFIDVAFLLGVADAFDSRSAVSADLDRDGRVDLIVTESLGSEGEKLHIYRNRLDTGNSWIGVELREQGDGISPVGASVRLHTTQRTHVGRVVTGDTLMGQHAATVHFGLGKSERVEAIEVRWTGGKRTTFREPEPNRYHLVQAATGSGAGVGAPEVLDASLEVPADVLRGPELFKALLSELPKSTGEEAVAQGDR